MAESELRFVLFGGVGVRRGGVGLELGPPLRRAVLAMLLAAGDQPIGTDEIVDALWGDDPAPSAVNSVHRSVGELRRLFEPGLPSRAHGRWVVRVGKGYRLAVDAGCADLLAFRAGVAEARADGSPDAVGRYAVALDLARGPVAAGVEAVRGHHLVAGIERERIDVAVEAADVAVRRGGAAVILPALQRLAAAEPLDEPLHARLVTALAAAGRRPEALAVYAVVRDRLAEELGADPSEVLADARRRALEAGTEARTPAAVRPAQLPASTSTFAGRDAELSAVLGLLGAGSPVMISAIGGMAGVGKTTLAVHCAHRIADRFPDGQLYVNLRGFDADERVVAPEEALRGFLEALGDDTAALPDRLEDRIARYRSLLAGRRILILLDNARDADQVRPLLPGTPDCRVIVTSRNQLNYLIASHGARPVRLGPLSEPRARQVLARRFGPARLAADPTATDTIIAACGGLPLALAIIGARAAMSAFPLSVLAGELDDAAAKLDALAGDEATVDVRAVFSWSCRALSPTPAALFRQLAVHPGPEVSLTAAASIAGLPAREVRAALGELLAGNLIDEVSPGRYAMHDLLRAYAAELLEPADRDPAFRRLVSHYAHSMRAAWLV